MKFLTRALSASALVVSLATPALAAEKLVVVTSFPVTLTGPFEAAFEKKYPNVDVEIINKSTSSGVKYIQETASSNTTDLFWASAPDAFEVLKNDGLLLKTGIANEQIPDNISGFPMNDPEGYYQGFAAAGYGIMYNERYLAAKKLPVPAEWEDLAKPEYFGHVGMSAPSRSGTTHLTVEALLQGDGWEDGWAKWKFIAGNFSTVTERSFGVPDGVNSGQTGLGIVIDFFGLASKASGFPVDFVYPSTTAIVPANVGIVKNAPNAEIAADFVKFLLSTEGQEILMLPEIRRLPVNVDAYKNTPEGFPNPFDGSIKATVNFDVDLSGQRYNVVNSLFDVMITYRLNDLQKAVQAVQKAEKKLGSQNNAEAQKLIDEARALIAAMPVDKARAHDPEFVAIFKQKRKAATDVVEGRQAQIEQQWDAEVVANYAKATELADRAASLL
ncbi:ABC transporter substrate-binding protein [Marinobacter sp. X15-166B]|uniref:ABC transporter substrate-binding protein n=1 Tax=Marinobacter sp. X15-166B TaxID=1897620 RepID=UPI00085BAF81|nr:extracellular solute-binding protein [Marinobacter sp. X15-166B]OEY67043.1 ABC transporter substrate-binding protein [Marinobacter sp. X15-166B]